MIALAVVLGVLALVLIARVAFYHYQTTRAGLSGEWHREKIRGENGMTRRGE